MLQALLPAAISAGAGLIGGAMNRRAQEEVNAQQMAMARENMALQKQFAQEGIRWKVDDARAAGIHPLYALGASTVSYSPVSVGLGADTSMGSALASAGQDISRAVSATMTQGEREQKLSDTASALSLQRMGLENELLATRVAKEKSAQVGPPFPGFVPEDNEVEKRVPIAALGTHAPTEPGTSPAKAWEDQFGEPGGWVAAAIHAHHWLKQTHPGVAAVLARAVQNEKRDLDYLEDVVKGKRSWLSVSWKRPAWSYRRDSFKDRFGKWR